MGLSEQDEVLRALSGTRLSASGWWSGPCPFCPTDKRRPSFGVHAETGRYHCFRCGQKGRIEPELLLDAGLGAPRAVREKPASFEPDGFTLLCGGADKDSIALAPARAYLQGRGLGFRQCREAHVGAVVRWRRVVVPILSASGAWLGWSARDWTGTSDRPYLYPKGMPRAGLLYNEAALVADTDTPLLVVEGVLDALAYWPDAVAVLGKVGRGQVTRLMQTERPVCFVLDGDAWREGQAWAQYLVAHGRRAGHVRLPPRTDPDEVPRAWLVAECRRSFERMA